MSLLPPLSPPQLFLALLQPPVSVVAILGELLATLPRQNELILLKSSGQLYLDLDKFTMDLRETIECICHIWWRGDITFDDDFSPTSLSRALVVYKSTPWTIWFHVAMVASNWQGMVADLVKSWVQLAGKATQLRNTCRRVVNEAATKVAIPTARARELQDKAAHDETAQENMVELGQAQGGEEGAKGAHATRVKRDARVAASWAAKYTMVRQRVDVALGLLEGLVAACDEATAFPRELQCRLEDIQAAMKGTNEASPDVPEDLVAKVAIVEGLWEANARLAKDHLLGAVDDIIKFYFDGAPASPSACGVAKRCQRAIEDIPRLLRPPERPQRIPKVSPVSMEPQELSPDLLQPQVTVVAIVGELLATLPRRDKVILLETSGCLYWDLVAFTEKLRVTLYCIDDTWWTGIVTSDEDDPPTSLSQALDAYESTKWTTWDRVTSVASKWQGLVAVVEESWARLARAATKLHNTCREVVTEAVEMAATATTQATELQDKAACDGTAQENMVGLGQALGGEEVAEVVAGHEAWVRREPRVAASEATRATMVRQWVEEALGLLERLVAACDETTAFPRELQRLLRDIKASVKETYFETPAVPEDLVAKVAVAERLWEANAHLVKDHLLGAVPDTIKFYFTGGPGSPSAYGVAERCQRAIEDIPRLLQSPDCLQSVRKASSLSMELQEVSPPQLQALVAVVATLGKVVATVTGPHWGKFLHPSPDSLYEDLKNFTQNLCKILYHGDVTSLGHRGVTSLGRALAALRATPDTTWADVRAEASAWWESVAKLVDNCDQLAREATKLRDACGKVIMDQHLMVALDTKEVAWEMATHDAQVAAVTNKAMGKAVVATRRGHWTEVALGPLERLVAACDKVTLFNWNMECRLRDIEAALKGTNEVSPDVLQDLGAKVTKFEWLWVASARLAKDHLLGTLGVIYNILLSPCGDHGDPIGPSSHAVAKQCQKAIEDIPRLLWGQ